VVAEPNPIERYRNNLQGEVDSAVLYRVLAESESNPQMKEVYRRLAAVEEAHAEFWRGRLSKLGAAGGRRRVSFRTRALAFLARRFGPNLVLPIINSFERSGSEQYDNQPEAVSA